jgi:hypothetical protein
VVSKELRSESWSLEGVGEGAERIGESTPHDQDKALGSAAAVDLGKDGYCGPTDDEVGERIYPFGRIDGPLSHGDSDQSSGDHDEKQNEANSPMHGQADDGEVTAGDRESARLKARR